MFLGNMPKMLGMIYAIIALLILVYLFHKDKFNQKIGYLFLTISTLMGFLVFSPMFPTQLQSILLGNIKQLGAPLPLAILGLALFIVLTFVFGRIFCGYLCPIGAIQEIFYLLPTSKKKITSKKYIIIFRIIFFLFIISSALIFSINTLFYLGISSFFKFGLTSIFLISFSTLLLISTFFYRPFCRFFCPYGVFQSFIASVSIFKLKRNNKCIECGKCEKICPTNEAGKNDLKQECYMCNRCREICPVHAIDYRKK